MPTYEYYCGVCEALNVVESSYSSRPNEVPCRELECTGVAIYRISAPNLMLKEAMLDGTKRKGWDSMREASKLNKQRALQNNEKDKKRIEGEIRKLGVKVSKE